MRNQDGNFLLQALLALCLVVAFIPFFADTLARRDTNAKMTASVSQITTTANAARLYLRENPNWLNSLSGDAVADALEPYGLPLGFVPRTAFDQDISLNITYDDVGIVAQLELSEVAICQMVVNVPCRLQMGIAYCRTKELEPAPLHICRNLVGQRRTGWYIRQCFRLVHHRLAAWQEPTQIFAKTAELFLNLDKMLRIGNRRLYFQAIADYTCVAHQSFNIRLCKFRHFTHVKVCERTAIVFPLAQYGYPGQSRLGRFQGQKFEHSAIITYQPPPLGIVILYIKRIIPAPPTSFDFFHCFAPKIPRAKVLIH